MVPEDRVQAGFHMVREIVPEGFEQTYPSLEPGHLPPPWGDASVHVAFVDGDTVVFDPEFVEFPDIIDNGMGMLDPQDIADALTESATSVSVSSISSSSVSVSSVTATSVSTAGAPSSTGPRWSSPTSPKSSAAAPASTPIPSGRPSSS